jgi:hypothetical protein
MRDMTVLRVMWRTLREDMGDMLPVRVVLGIVLVHMPRILCFLLSWRLFRGHMRYMLFDLRRVSSIRPHSRHMRPVLARLGSGLLDMGCSRLFRWQGQTSRQRSRDMTTSRAGQHTDQTHSPHMLTCLTETELSRLGMPDMWSDAWCW